MRYSIPNEFDHFFEGFFGPLSVREEGFRPSCDVKATESHYLLHFDLPGVEKKNINIEVKDHELVVSGERKNENSERNEYRYVSERSYGKFERNFSLPEDVEADGVEASYKDGVLYVALPKTPAPKARKIEVREGSSGVFKKLLGKKEAAAA